MPVRVSYPRLAHVRRCRTALPPFRLLGLKREPDRAATRSEQVAVAQHRRSHSFFPEEGPVGRVKVFQVNHLVSYLQNAVMARDFRVFQGDIGALAAEYRASAPQGKRFAALWPAFHRQDHLNSGRKSQAIIGQGQPQVLRGGVCSRKGRHRRNHYGFIGPLLHFDDGGLAAPGATELHLAVLRQHLVLQQMLLAAMNASGLHISKLACSAGPAFPMVAALARTVTRAGLASELRRLLQRSTLAYLCYDNKFHITQESDCARAYFAQGTETG